MGGESQKSSGTLNKKILHKYAVSDALDVFSVSKKVLIWGITLMRRFASLLLVGLLLSSCGDQISYNSSTTERDELVPDEALIDQAPLSDFDYSVLSPGQVNFDVQNVVEKGDRPSVLAKRYMRVEVSRDKSKTSHNNLHFSEGVRRIVISAKEIEFSEEDLQGIHSLLNKQNDIASVELNAEVVRILKSLEIPGADFTINAQKLVIGPDATLTLSPLGFPEGAAQFQDGKDGVDAPNLVLNTKEVSGLSQRNFDDVVFYLIGGRGQSAGHGQDGAKGADVSDLGNGVVYKTIIQTHCVNIRDAFGAGMMKLTECHEKPSEAGIKTWPTNGADARPGGKPGRAGAGGKVFSSLKLDAKIFALNAGIHGNPAPPVYWGGQPGRPVTSYHAHEKLDHKGRQLSFQHTASRTTIKGADAYSPEAILERGTAGRIFIDKRPTLVGDGVLEFSLKYATDLYKANRADEAKGELFKIQELCESAKLMYATSFCAKASEMILSINSQLDYYGNRATWAPNLSLESTYKLFGNEISRSIRTLYLTYWLLEKNKTLESRKLAISEQQESLRLKIESNKKLFEALRIKLPALEKRISDLRKDEKSFRDELRHIEKVILDEASRNVNSRHRVPFYKKAISTIAALSTVIPGGTPAISAAATTLNAFLQGVDTDKPWSQVIEVLPDTIGEMMPRKFEQSARQWNQARERIDIDNLITLFKETPRNEDERDELWEKRAAYFKELANFTKPIANKLIEISKQNAKIQIPKSEIEAEVAKIRASHPQFQKISHMLMALLEKKSALVESLVQINLELGKISSETASAYTSIAKLSEASTLIERGIHAPLKSLLENMEDEARDRLERYGYLLRKAYEYRLLKSPSVNLLLGPVLEQIQSLVKASDNAILSPSEFDSIRSIYESELAKIVNGVVADYERRGSRYKSDELIVVLDQSQLRALNEGETTYLNLTSSAYFGESEEKPKLQDIRINDIRFQELDFEVEGSPTRVAKGSLEIEYPGYSYLQKNGLNYLYHFGSPGEMTKLTWSATYHALADYLTYPTPSVVEESLLRTLIDDTRDMMIFARPGGLTNLRLNLRTEIDSGAQMRLKRAVLVLGFDYLD